MEATPPWTTPGQQALPAPCGHNTGHTCSAVTRFEHERGDYKRQWKTENSSLWGSVLKAKIITRKWVFPKHPAAAILWSQPAFGGGVVQSQTNSHIPLIQGAAAWRSDGDGAAPEAQVCTSQVSACHCSPFCLPITQWGQRSSTKCLTLPAAGTAYMPQAATLGRHSQSMDVLQWLRSKKLTSTPDSLHYPLDSQVFWPCLWFLSANSFHQAAREDQETDGPRLRGQAESRSSHSGQGQSTSACKCEACTGAARSKSKQAPPYQLFPPLLSGSLPSAQPGFSQNTFHSSRVQAPWFFLQSTWQEEQAGQRGRQ